MDHDELYKKAKERAEAKAGFLVHLATYFVVNLGLLALNLITSPNSLWVIFPVIGWGIGLVAHFMGVFVFDNFYSRYVENEIKKEMNKYQQ